MTLALPRPCSRQTRRPETTADATPGGAHDKVLVRERVLPVIAARPAGLPPPAESPAGIRVFPEHNRGKKSACEGGTSVNSSRGGEHSFQTRRTDIGRKKTENLDLSAKARLPITAVFKLRFFSPPENIG
jgi:hypothetical protein